MKRHTSLGLLLAAALTASLLGGCAGSSSSQSGSSSAVSTPAATETAAETEASMSAGESMTAEEGTTAETEEKETAGSTAEAENAGGVDIVDMMGREIHLDGPADKIVALTAADCEILYAIGAGDLIVGRGEYCDYPAEVLEIPSVESGANTNIEQIVALEPQILVTSTMAQTKEQVDALEEAGIQVVVSNAQDIEGVYESIRMFGSLTGKEKEAEALTSQMQDTFDEIKEKSTGDGSETIYFEVSPLQWGLWTAGSGTFMDEAAQMVGLTNAFADLEGWAEISEEQVIERAPDYIMTITMYFGEGPLPEEEIASRPGWESIPAVKNGKILDLPNNELSRPGPRLADGALALYDFVYGEAAMDQAS